MAIKNYGLDAAEIENLKKANLTDEEINDLNRKRVKEQMDDEGFEDIDAEEKSIRDVIPNAPSIVATFINQRFGSPADGMQMPDGIELLNDFFKKNPERAHAIEEASNGLNHDSIDFAIDLPDWDDERISASKIDFNSSAFITELIVNAMRDSGVKEKSLVTNKFID